MNYWPAKKLSEGWCLPYRKVHYCIFHRQKVRVSHIFCHLEKTTLDFNCNILVLYASPKSWLFIVNNYTLYIDYWSKFASTSYQTPWLFLLYISMHIPDTSRTKWPYYYLNPNPSACVIAYRNFCSSTSLELYSGSNRWLKHVWADGKRVSSVVWRDMTSPSLDNPSIGDRSLHLIT